MTDPVDSLASVLPVLSPISEELKEAFEALQRWGFGSVTLRFEHGKVRQVVVEGSFLTKDKGRQP